jgi:hypothetical protein
MSNRVAQLYGYTICLVAIIVGLLTVSSILDAVFERANPLQSEYSYGATLTSLEAYKATYMREQMMFARGAEQPDTLSESSLQRRYDALVADRLAAVRYRSAKTFTTSGVLLVFAIGLFVVHWRWVRRLRNGANAAV